MKVDEPRQGVSRNLGLSPPDSNLLILERIVRPLAS